MEFKEKQFDGPYEVAGIDINNEGELFKGVMYFPPESFKKPHPLVIYFHGFPQIFTLQEIVKNYSFLLDLGYVFIVFNFRGYQYSKGKVSISSQLSDALKIIEFSKKMAENNILDFNNINIIGHDFGAYVALLLSSKIEILNRLLLISPILDIKRQVNHEDFKKMLYYINRFLPGNVRGIENIDEFLANVKKELSLEEFQIRTFIKLLNIKKLRVVTGEIDKITPVSEVYDVLKDSNVKPEISIIECMDHECGEEEEIDKLNQEIKRFFTD